jgi:uncharacterized protein (UPF0147 family)
MDEISQVLSILRDLEEDEDTPKSVRAKMCAICEQLGCASEKLDISKAMHEIENISEDNNIPSHTRMQLFSVVSMLELM